MTENPKVQRPAKRRHRGVTLIEAVLYIAIALALIVGGLVFYQQAAAASRVNSSARSLSFVIAEARTIVAASGTASMNDIAMERILIGQGSVPSDIIDMTKPAGHRIRTPWGSRFYIAFTNSSTVGTLDLLYAIIDALPVAACARLMWSDASGGNIFTTNLDVVYVNDDDGRGTSFLPRGSSPSDAATACKTMDRDGNGLVRAQVYLRVAD